MATTLEGERIFVANAVRWRGACISASVHPFWRLKGRMREKSQEKIIDNWDPRRSFKPRPSGGQGRAVGVCQEGQDSPISGHF